MNPICKQSNTTITLENIYFVGKTNPEVDEITLHVAFKDLASWKLVISRNWGAPTPSYYSSAMFNRHALAALQGIMGPWPKELNFNDSMARKHWDKGTWDGYSEALVFTRDELVAIVPQLEHLI